MNELRSHNIRIEYIAQIQSANFNFTDCEQYLM